MLRFGPFVLSRGVLTKHGEVVRLPPKEMGVLRRLLEARGGVVTRDELIAAAWGAEPVSDASLSRCIHALRRILAWDDTHPTITTMHRVGFRFVPRVTEVEEDGPAPGLPEIPFAEQGYWPRDPDLAELYLHVRELAAHRTLASLSEAIDLARRMLDKTPDFAAGWVHLANLHLLMCTLGCGREPTEHAYRARDAADRASSLSPESRFGIAERAWIDAVIEGRSVDHAAFDPPIQVAPWCWLLLAYRAWAMASQGRIELALPDLQLALERNPVSPDVAFPNGYLLLCGGRLDDALRYTRAATSDLPASDGAWHARALVAAWRGKTGEAISAALRAVELSEGLPEMRAALAYALARAGDTAAARRELHQAMRTPGTYTPPTLAAAVYAALGDHVGFADQIARGEEIKCPFRGVGRLDPRLQEIGDDAIAAGQLA